ncbi:hypothetical protein [Allorhodopirellula solitaria]|uniref:Uncharacterized protein n=1 Tax=Allorhodopirellula solitaria TaxID=2527987 RepID=A0A5C5YEK0_9BACT|nr:hypothetical protein [Allorhodopirellula solitaria]TWT73359.1 hypothetical protein CA85_18280 [Allorhodopirellula solitaria]
MYNQSTRAQWSGKRTSHRAGVVANGYRNLISGVEAEARQEVTAKYAEQWKSAGWLGRWRLQRLMDAEIEELAIKRFPKVSQDTMF